MFSKREYSEKTKNLINIFSYSQIEKFKVELTSDSIFKYQITDVYSLAIVERSSLFSLFYRAWNDKTDFRPCWKPTADQLCR